MRRIFTAPDRALAGFVKSVLEDHGLTIAMKNEYVGGGVGEIPAQECWPELWVVDDRDALRAKALIDTVLAARQAPGPAWQCQDCGEWLEAQFVACWRCAGTE